MMNSGLKCIAGIALLGIFITPAHAVTTHGYMRAGGVGMVPCAAFTNLVAESRQVGLESAQGINKINAFFSYALGYYTHYNASMPGIYDVLTGVNGDHMVVTLITILDTWCAVHPLKVYDDAVDGVLPMLLEGASVGAAP
jgi:hypothetical protein